MLESACKAEKITGNIAHDNGYSGEGGSITAR